CRRCRHSLPPVPRALPPPSRVLRSLPRFLPPASRHAHPFPRSGPPAVGIGGTGRRAVLAACRAGGVPCRRRAVLAGVDRGVVSAERRMRRRIGPVVLP